MLVSNNGVNVVNFQDVKIPSKYQKHIKAIQDFSYIVSDLYIANEKYTNEVFDLSMIDITNCNFNLYAIWELVFDFNMSEELKNFCECFKDISKERLEKIFDTWGNFYSIYLIYRLTAYHKAVDYLENPHLLPKQLQPEILKNLALNQRFSFLKDKFDEESKKEPSYFYKTIIDNKEDENVALQYENVYFAFEMQYAIDNK